MFVSRWRFWFLMMFSVDNNPKAGFQGRLSHPLAANVAPACLNVL